jgi:hypothetical protein
MIMDDHLQSTAPLQQHQRNELQHNESQQRALMSFKLYFFYYKELGIIWVHSLFLPTKSRDGRKDRAILKQEEIQQVTVNPRKI